MTKENQDLITKETETIEAIDRDAKGLVAMQKRAGFMGKIFNKKQYEEYQEHELSIIKTELEYQQNSLKSTREGDLKLVRESVNTLVSTESAKLLTEREKMLDKIRTMRDTYTNELSEEFVQKWEEAYAKAEKISNLKAKELQLSRLDKQLEEYFETSDFFTEKYRNAITFES